MRFSVIVPCYNIEKYIVQCIESILAQTFTDYELILVDDGSKDATAGILDKYQKRDNRIKVIHKSNGGLTSARKAGAELAAGDYVAIVDGDDWIIPEYLEEFSKAIDKGPVDVACCGYYEMLGEEEKRESCLNKLNNRYGYFTRKEIEEFLLPDLFRFKPVVWSKVFRREVYLKYQMTLDSRISMGEDGAITYPCILNANEIFLIEKCMYYYRLNMSSLTKQPKKIISWENVKLRIARFEEYLPFEKYGLYDQFSEYVAHAAFNASVTHLKNEPYGTAKKGICSFLGEEKNRKYIKNALKSKDKKNKIAAFALYYKMIVLLKIWAYVNR